MGRKVAKKVVAKELRNDIEDEGDDEDFFRQLDIDDDELLSALDMCEDDLGFCEHGTTDDEGCEEDN